MEITWKVLLDDIKLPDDTRKVADLIVLEDFLLEFPEKVQIAKIASYIKTFLKSENAFTIAKPTRSIMSLDGSVKLEQYYQTIPLDNIDVLKEEWVQGSGSYILILSDQSIPDEDDFQCDDEEMIGRILIKFKRLLLKTPDGDKLLYLYLNHI